MKLILFPNERDFKDCVKVIDAYLGLPIGGTETYAVAELIKGKYPLLIKDAHESDIDILPAFTEQQKSLMINYSADLFEPED